MSETPYAPHTRAWRELEAHAARMKQTSIRDMIANDPARFDTLAFEAGGLLLDFTRQRFDRDVLDTLSELAHEVDVPGWITRMFAGAHINNTEDRPALHVALRRPADEPLVVDGVDVMPAVEAERQKIRALADALHAGELCGATGKPITDVVNIGIGGSDLGIAMALKALAEYRLPACRFHCVSNIDGVALAHVLQHADPETTLFVICSKSFTTLETLTNARAARAWLHAAGGDAAVAAQCVAISTNHAAMDAFGIDPDKRLALWDWVGGRYSVWSTVGLAVALGVGWQNFEAFLAGGHALDKHFETMPFERNLPVQLALVGIWNRNFLDAASHAVLPYDDHLARFPAFLQQLEMESNGKSVRRNGVPVESATCPVIWGEPGSNAQHSFYQLLHQGTESFSADFVLPAKSAVGRQDQQDLAAANCFAQAWALACGDPRTADAGDDSTVRVSADPHRHYPGDRPSTLLAFERLDPATLGRLVALYEHKVFVQGVIWDVNSFDQWGVELGKRLAAELETAVAGKAAGPAAVTGALERWRRWRDG